MSTIKKFKKGLYEFDNLFKISDPTTSVPDTEVKSITPYRGIIQIQGDIIEAEDVNAIQQNGTIVTTTSYLNNLGSGVDGYQLNDYNNEQGIFEGLKLKVQISSSNVYENPKLVSNDGTIYDTTKVYSGNHVPIDANDLSTNRIYDFIYLDGVFQLQGQNRATENNTGVVTEARIKELATEIVNNTMSAYVPVPVGGLYISTNSVNPTTIWSGTTWELYAPGQVLVGINASNSNFQTLGQTGGVQTVTLTVDQMPSHTHSNSVVGDHAHYVNPNGNHTHVVDNHSHYVSPHQHVAPWGENTGLYSPPWGVYGSNNLIGNDKATYDNSWGYTSPTDMWTNGAQPGTSAAGWHDHGTAGAGSHSHTNGNTGGTQAHTNLQPYIVVNIWRRLT